MSLFRLPLIAICSVAICAAPAFAQTAPAAAPAAGSKIAVVNTQSIMRDSTAAKSVREQLDAKQKSYQTDIGKKEEALQKEDQELAKQKGALAKEAFEAKIKAFREKATATQKEVQDKKATLDAAYERSVIQIQKTVSDIITELAKEKGFTIALANSVVLYNEPGMDISNDVLTRLNQRLPKIDVKFESPAKK